MICLQVKDNVLDKIQQVKGLQQVQKKLIETYIIPETDNNVFNPLVIGGGKLLRPILLLLCGSFTPALTEKLIDAAVSVELIHSASLIHDDVVDNSDFRRGLPTVASLWGKKEAVLYGDFLFARAFLFITRHKLIKLLKTMMQTIGFMSEGEILQSFHRYDCDWTELDYMKYIYKKTAYFISSCCTAGAYVSGLSTAAQKSLACYGLHLGYAYQIIDDLLDFDGEAKITGKQVMHDLPEGCITLPVIRLLQHPQHEKKVREIIVSRDFSPSTLVYIRTAIESQGILAEIKEQAKEEIKKAKSCLSLFPETKSRKLLEDIADYVIVRRR